MKSQDFQFASYTPAEFEQFRTAVQQDGFTVTQNTIDTVSGHIGSLTYLTGKYNRNQQLLVVTIKTSPWQSMQDGDVETNVLRVVNKSAAEETPINATPVTTPITKAGTPATAKVATNPAGGPKNAVVPPALTTAQAANVSKVLQQAQVAKPSDAGTTTTPIVPKQTPVPAASTTPAEAATTTPTKQLVGGPVGEFKKRQVTPLSPLLNFIITATITC